MESKTPRTDSQCRIVKHTTYFMGAALSDDIDVVDATLCRKIETELADARAEIERKDKLIEQMREALSIVDAIGDEKGSPSGNDALRCFSIAKAALEAAERGE